MAVSRFHFTTRQKEVLKQNFHEKNIQSTGKGHKEAMKKIAEEIDCPVEKVKVSKLAFSLSSLFSFPLFSLSLFFLSLSLCFFLWLPHFFSPYSSLSLSFFSFFFAPLLLSQTCSPISSQQSESHKKNFGPSYRPHAV